MSAAGPNCLARSLRGFFADHLPRVRGASPHTARSYRDAFALLLRFLAERRSRAVVRLDFDDLEPEEILAFLDYLENQRGNGRGTRNARLAAIHAFATYAASLDPQHVELCQRLLAIPFKRADTRIVEYLEADELRVILDGPDLTQPDGRRDHALLLTMFNTGARVQEVVDLRPRDLQLVRPLQVLLRGKGSKERVCPLWPKTADALRSLIAENGVAQDAADQLFRNRLGQPITRFGVRYLVRKYTLKGVPAAPTLARKRVHPHTMRHTTAVHLLQAGVDLVTISHWLGHASVETTNRYAAVNLDTKRAALAKAGPLADSNDSDLATWRADASILEWLEKL